eukprot:scaffold7344_cov145-Cylindrotheca_fusiformis.AAC.6
MTNQEQEKQPAHFEDLTISSIFEHYLDESRLNSEDEEDVVLAALAILEEDDRESRGLTRRELREEAEKQQIQGAAFAGGLAGFALMGPVGALAAAGSSALAAARNQGFAGDIARDMGHTMQAMRQQVASSIPRI